MKRFLWALCLVFISPNVVSQEKFSIDVSLDPKLALMRDDYGNTPFTLNSLVNFSVQLQQLEHGYYFFGQSVEYANLSGGKYFRYSILQVGYTFNKFPLSDRIEASMALNYGIVKRWTFDFSNFGAIFNLSYAFTDRLRISSFMQDVRRTDIESPNDSEDIYRTSFCLGLRFDVFGTNVM